MSDYNSGENAVESVKTEEVKADNGIKLYIGDTILDGINISIKNIGPMLVNIIFWVLTFWIPYLNVGTTIGMTAGIIPKLSRGEPISYTEIFDPKYRKYMGDYFLTIGLLLFGVFAGILFFIIPGYILAIAWSLALLLVVDKGKNPMEALKLSNDITYGHKGRIFLIYLIIGIISFILQVVLIKFDNNFAIFLLVIVYIILNLLVFGIQASIYKQLVKDV